MQGEDGEQDAGKSTCAVDENVPDLRRSPGDKGLMKLIRSCIGGADAERNQSAGTQRKLFPGMSPDGEEPGDPKKRVFRKVGGLSDKKFTPIDVQGELGRSPGEMKHIPKGAQKLSCDHQTLRGRGIRVLGRKAENHRHDQNGWDKGQKNPAPFHCIAIAFRRKKMSEIHRHILAQLPPAGTKDWPMGKTEIDW